MSVRARLLAFLDCVGPLRRATIAATTAAARRCGADGELLTLVEREHLPLDRTLQAIQWTTALAGRGRAPRHFQPGDHLASPIARRRSAELAARSDDPSFRRSLIGVDDTAALDSLAALVADDLTAALREGATRPAQRAGTDPSAQRRLTHAIHLALADVGIDAFLMSGTLLGVIREGDFMAHDYDVDLGLLPGTDVELVERTLHRVEGARVEQVGPRLVVRVDDVTADVFEHVERDGRWWHSTFVHEWWNTPFQLMREKQTGLGLWIPDDPERYLRENYGDWSRPVPFYEISFDTPNRRYRRNSDALRFLHSRVHIGLRNGDRWLVESAARELRDSFGVDVTELLAASPLLD